MVPAIRPSLTNPSAARSARRPARSRQRPPLRTRRLGFEVCEPRWPLTAVLDLTSFEDLTAGDEPFPVEPAAEVCPEHVRATKCVSDVPDPSDPSDTSDTSDTNGGGDAPEWNDLHAGLDPIGLAGALEEFRGECTECADTESSYPQRLAQNQLEESHEPDGTARQTGESVASNAAAAVPSGFDAERREWTAAGAVRYPLPSVPPPRSLDDTRVPLQLPAASAGFLDVGRLMPSGTARRWQDPAPLERLEFVPSDTAPSALVNDLAIVELSARSAKSPKVSAAATAVRPALTGENRSQRMLLLATARPRKPTLVPPLPAPASRPEEIRDIQAREDAPALPVDAAGSPAVQPSAAATTLGSLPWSFQAPIPVAESRVSRSAIEGFAVFVLLAAGWLRRPHRRPAAMLATLAKLPAVLLPARPFTFASHDAE